MKKILRLLETYLMVLVHPYRIHHQFRFNVPIPNHGGRIYSPLSLAESLGISWLFAIIRGLGKIIIMNFFLFEFLKLQSDEFPFLQDFVSGGSTSTYYFFLFSAALDIIFFPIATLILTEVWAWVIKKYAGFLNPNLPAEQIADQITTHALSSSFFTMIPFVGDGIQYFLYHFLIFTGLRANLGASRSLSWVILLTPTIFLFMALTLLFLMIFYLMK